MSERKKSLFTISSSTCWHQCHLSRLLFEFNVWHTSTNDCTHFSFSLSLAIASIQYVHTAKSPSIKHANKTLVRAQHTKIQLGSLNLFIRYSNSVSPSDACIIGRTDFTATKMYRMLFLRFSPILSRSNALTRDLFCVIFLFQLIFRISFADGRLKLKCCAKLNDVASLRRKAWICGTRNEERAQEKKMSSIPCMLLHCVVALGRVSTANVLLEMREMWKENMRQKKSAGNVLFAVECIELVENCLDISCAIASVTETDSKKSCQFDIVTRILCVLDTLCHHWDNLIFRTLRANYFRLMCDWPNTICASSRNSWSTMLQLQTLKSFKCTIFSNCFLR